MGDFEPKQFGKYFLIDKLAMGGMAEIYKAKTYGVDGFEKLLVIKRILPHAAADRDFITMLIDEAKLSVLLSHANIVQVYDLGKVGDDYFIAMEFINGVNLRDIMYACREANRQLPPDIAVYIISELCKGLDYAHRKTDSNNKPLNIVHRDISPQNVLISYEGEVKIVDFGIAKAAMNISHTMAGILKGKIAYMSPEQAMGKLVDRRTDIFSTGILLYETITGTKLFTGESQFEVLKKIRTSDVKAAELSDMIPAAVKPILAKSLAADIEQRYQNAGDLQIDLTKYLYSTHVDFSPRKLASFISELFERNLMEQQETMARDVAHEAQTASMNVEEGAKQVDIVHRDITQPRADVTAPVERPHEELYDTAMTPVRKARTRDTTEAAPSGPPPVRRDWNRFKKAAAVLAIALVLFAVWKYVPQIRFWEREKPPEAAKVTTANIDSAPQGATIIVDGRRTGLATPAIVPSLEVGKSYRIRLEMAGHIPVDQMIVISSAQPLSITIPLAQESGTANVTSSPPGASIVLNDKDTGKVTPATIEQLPLGVDQRITLKRDGFEDASQIVKLSDARPQSIDFVLKEILPDTGSLTVVSEPPGATIEIDGFDSGRVTPTTIANLKLDKEHTIRLTLEDLEPFTQTFTITDATKPLDIKAKLQPPKPPEPELPAVVAKGSISVTSTPAGATIYLNRRATGKRTPTTLTDLDVDKNYRVGMALEGYQDYSTTINIKETKEYSVSASLSRKPTPPPPTQPPPEPVTPTRPPPEPARPPAAVEAYGELSISSTPPRATVTFDGQVIPAKTPVTIRRVPTNRPHTVTVSLPGYRSWSRSFTMTSSTMSFHANLQPE